MGLGERIKEARQAKRLSQTALAKLVNQAQTTISSWETSRTTPTREDVARLASVLDVDAVQLEGRPAQPLMVPVVGYVAAGAQAVFFGAGDGELDRVEAPEGSGAKTVAVELRGESLGPLFDHWLVFYDDIRSPVTPDLWHKLCVVGLPGDRILVKLVKPTKTEGVFHLLSNNEGPILDQEVEWAARVRSMTPR